MPPKVVQKKDSGIIEAQSSAQLKDQYLWPEWCETQINNERWDGGSGKKPEKGKSPSPTVFDDPEGQPVLPESLATKCKSWKRISDLYINGGGTTIFEELPGLPPSIVQANISLSFSPFIRHLLSAIRTVQEFTHDNEALEDFRPGHLIYSLNKSGKEHKPLVNNNGKYIVKLFWLGKFRKITIDDFIPCDENGVSLLPASQNIAEIWPLILSKAVLKVCSFGFSNRSREIPEFHAVTALTGWLPEVLNGSCVKTWELLQEYLSESLELVVPAEEPKPAVKEKDKKDKKKKDEGPVVPPARVGTFCLAEIEHADAPIHPCQIVKVRDRPLRPPSPDPEIPAWKLIRPRQDVLQMLSEIEKKQIPNRWCMIKSPFQGPKGEAEDDETEILNSTADLSQTDSVPNPNDWMRIEDITNDENSKIFLFHIPKSPLQKVISHTRVTPVDEDFVDEVHTSYFYADMLDEDQDIIVSFQVQNRNIKENNSEGEDSTVCTPDTLEKHRHVVATTSMSTLRIQKCNLRKYDQDTEDILVNETYAQGSVRFRLPRGRTVLRFRIQSKFASTISVICATQLAPNVVYGNLSAILRAASEKYPYSWIRYTKSLLHATEQVTLSFGDKENYQKAIRKLKSYVGNDTLWECYRIAFYKFASKVLQGAAIPEDLGALRMLFRDFHPTPGPAIYIDALAPKPLKPETPPPKSAVKGKKKTLDMSAFTKVTASAIAATTLIKTWRGHIARRNFDAIMGTSPGAQRRQQSAKARFKEFFERLDENSGLKLVELFVGEAKLVGEENTILSADMLNTFKTTSIEGKFSTVTDEKGMLFREKFTLDSETELFPVFSEFNLDKKFTTQIRLIDDEGNHIGKILRRVRPVTLGPGTYTLIGDVSCTGCSQVEPPPGASWSLQLVYDFTREVVLGSKEYQSSVIVERGVYLPSTQSTFEPGLLFRYMIGMSVPMSASFFLKATCPTAKLKLIIKDGGRELFTAYGTGEIFIPQWESKIHSIIESGTGTISRTTSRTSKTGKKNASITSLDTVPVPGVEASKLSIEAHSSVGWILTESELEAIKTLRNQEVAEIRVHGPLLPVPSKPSKKSVTSFSSLPEDSASWKLMVFVDQDRAENIELKFDNSRKEKIKAMKMAWEAADPGRHEKAVENRKKYLESVRGNPPKLKDLLAKVPRGSLNQDPEEMMKDYMESRERAEAYLTADEERRQTALETYATEYDEMEEREATILEQIRHSFKPSRPQAAV